MWLSFPEQTVQLVETQNFFTSSKQFKNRKSQPTKRNFETYIKKSNGSNNGTRNQEKNIFCALHGLCYHSTENCRDISNLRKNGYVVKKEFNSYRKKYYNSIELKKIAKTKILIIMNQKIIISIKTTLSICLVYIT